MSRTVDTGRSSTELDDDGSLLVGNSLSELSTTTSDEPTIIKETPAAVVGTKRPKESPSSVSPVPKRTFAHSVLAGTPANLDGLEFPDSCSTPVNRVGLHTSFDSFIGDKVYTRYQFVARALN